jgi:DNA-binding LacI/PurR family transcriptional regulator
MSAAFRTRSAVKQNGIVEKLRERIVQGEIAPGSQLPTRSVLGQEYGVSSATLQRALDKLTRDGFVYARGKAGTYVSETPPHLSRYGLVFPHGPGWGRGWNRFWQALANEAQRLQEVEQRQIPIYYGGEGHADERDFQKLLRDVEGHRVAGLIFTHPPYYYRGTPILDQPGMPRVAITTGDYGMPAVTAGETTFIRRALDYLASKGRQRIAIVSISGYFTAASLGVWRAELAARGMACGPHWMQGVHDGHPEQSQNIVQLLMYASGQERPDGLIIADDNLVEHATAGLISAGVRVPDDVEVVAHCNFPWPTPSVVPVRRLGYDARRLLALCVEKIDRMRSGSPVEAVTELEAVFEEEASCAAPAASQP